MGGGWRIGWFGMPARGSLRLSERYTRERYVTGAGMLP